VTLRVSKDERGLVITCGAETVILPASAIAATFDWDLGSLRSTFFVRGRRVELHPATDRWMMGDRYGEVVKVEPERVRVRLDKSRKSFWFRREDVLHPGNRNP